jgi:muramoyltetrapeptide carboxypeptidase
LFWKALGWLAGYFRPHFDPTIFERAGFFAGSDDRRRAEFQSAIDDPEATAIIVARGGWGAARFANSLDYTGLIANPKWLVGFSDPTILHMQSWRLGIASMHASNLVALGRADVSARYEWLDALEFPSRHRVLRGKSLCRGQTRGVLVGGNLTVLISGLSAGHLRFPDRCILALEDVAESSYRIDRMLSALIISGAMDKVGAVALGQFVDCDSGTHGIPVEQVLASHLLPMGIPVIFDLPFGHGKLNSPMPFGTLAVLNGNQGELHLGAAANA